MGAAVAHTISPELALVCPELRQHALTLLPTIDPDELFVVEPVGDLAPVGAVEPVLTPAPERPPLALVEPPRRAPLPVALAAYFTEAIFLGAIRGVALTAAIVVAAFVLSW